MARIAERHIVLSFRITRSENERLKRLAKKLDRSVSSVVRQMLQDFATRAEKKAG
jgi:predicted transcriptional regulator